MSVRTYDFNKVKLIIGGVPIRGFTDGTGIMIETVEDDFTTVSGSDGEASRSKSNNKVATLTITLANTSDSNDYLSFLRNADQASNQGVRNVIMEDFGGTTVVTSPAGYVRKMAPIERGKEITDSEWVLDLTQTAINNGGNPKITG